MTTQSLRIALSIAASLFLLAALVEDANARGEGRGGGRGGGGGGASFSRSGPAAGGSFSSQRSATRQVGATQRSGQRAETQQSRSQSRADTRASGQQERTERQGQRQQGQTERSETRQQGYTERTDIRNSGNWDSHYYDDDDDEWGYALAGAAIGATAGFIAGAATATPSPTYVTVLPCTPNVVTADGTNFYGCGGTWYGRSYVNGSVTYVTVNPPPGY